MKKLLTIVMSLAVASALFAAPAKTSKPAAKKEAAKPVVEFIIIESEDYKAGKQDEQLTAGVAGFLEAQPQVTLKTYSQAKADPKLSNMDYSFLPLYLVKKTPHVTAKMADMIKQGYVQETEDFVVLSKQTRTGVYAAQAAKPGVLEIFVMSQCPYGAMAENLVIKGQKDGKIPQDKEIKLRYIVTYDNQTGKFNSMHGSPEVEENIRQLLIGKYYPEKLWKYLEIRNQDYQSSRWDKAMDEAGINSKKIMKKFDTEGKELLKAEADYAQQYGINASPSFLWEGKVKLDFGGVSEIEGFSFLNPNLNQPQNGGGQAAPAGSC